MKPLIICTFICFFLLEGCDFKRNDDYFNEANAKSEKGDHLGAIDALSVVINRNPKNYEAFTNRGTEYAAIGKFKKAMKDYNKAIELNPKNTIAFYNRGNSKSKLMAYEEAVQDYNKAIELIGGEKFYLEMQDNKFLGVRPPDLEMEAIRFQRGVALSELSNYQDAFADFNYCVNRKFDIEVALLWRGVCLYNLGYTKKGCEDWTLSAHEEAKRYYNEQCLKKE